MHCLILKLQGPKLKKCRSYRTKRYINCNDTSSLGSIVRLGRHMGSKHWVEKLGNHQVHIVEAVVALTTVVADFKLINGIRNSCVVGKFSVT